MLHRRAAHAAYQLERTPCALSRPAAPPFTRRVSAPPLPGTELPRQPAARFPALSFRFLFAAPAAVVAQTARLWLGR